MGFFKVTNEIFFEKLTPIEFYVLCYLIQCRNSKTGKCFPSKSNIAASCCIATSSVSKAIKSLEKKNVIQICHNFKNNRQINNSYIVTLGLS